MDMASWACSIRLPSWSGILRHAARGSGSCPEAFSLLVVWSPDRTGPSIEGYPEAGNMVQTIRRTISSDGTRSWWVNDVYRRTYNEQQRLETACDIHPGDHYSICSNSMMQGYVSSFFEIGQTQSLTWRLGKCAIRDVIAYADANLNSGIRSPQMAKDEFTRPPDTKRSD
jgi:hypothetical protein